MGRVGHPSLSWLPMAMSALPPKADMCDALAYVRFGAKADMTVPPPLHGGLENGMISGASASTDHSASGHFPKARSASRMHDGRQDPLRFSVGFQSSPPLWLDPFPRVASCLRLFAAERIQYSWGAGSRHIVRGRFVACRAIPATAGSPAELRREYRNSSQDHRADYLRARNRPPGKLCPFENAPPHVGERYRYSGE